MKHLIVLLGAALACATAHACLPLAVPGESTAVQSIDNATGQQHWYARRHACIARLCDPRRALAALARAAAATQPSVALAQEIAAATVAPTPGSQEEYQYRVLHHAICGRLYDQPPAGNAVFAPRAAACGAAPVPPAQRWIVAKAAGNAAPAGTRPAYPWIAGKRGSLSNGRAPQDTPCDPAVGTLEGLTAYYGVNGSPSQVAVCVRAAP